MRFASLPTLAAGLFAMTCCIPASAQFTIVGLSATSNSPGTPAMALLTLSVASISNDIDDPGTLTIVVSDTDFLLPAPGPLTFTLTTNGILSPVAGTGVTTVDGANIAIQTFGDATNLSKGQGFTGPNYTTTAPASSQTFSYSGTTSVSGFSPSGLYSLTIKQVLTLPGHTVLTGVDTKLTVQPSVPEPGAMALLGCLSVPGAILLRRRS